MHVFPHENPDFVSKGFGREQYSWFMDPDHVRIGYGDLNWKSDGTQHEGSFQISDDTTLAIPVEYLIRVNQMKPDEPHLIVKLNGTHAARIDINGWHHFDGEKGSRQSTHFQGHDRGSNMKERTTEIAVPPFPALTLGVNVNYETELQHCFRASVAWLNVDVAGVTWSPLPFEGSK